MVFASMINPVQAVKKPWELFFLGLLIPTIAILVSLFVFQTSIGFNMIVLSTLATLPLVYNTIRLEEKKDLKLKNEGLRLRAHSKVLRFYVFFFLGSVLSFALWYIYTPSPLVEHIFDIQEETIQRVDSHVAQSTTSYAIVPESYFRVIFLHNIKILFFCLLLSLFFGAGAIYILTFNASLIGTAVGIFVKENVYGIVGGLSLGLLRYLTHGLFEIAAYFLAGLAGGIISIAIIRHHFTRKNMAILFQDSFGLIVTALLLLFIGTLVEVFITPRFF